MERKQFTWYRSYYDALKELPAEEFRDIVLAICAYALDGEEPELSGVARAIFTLIRPTLEVGRSKAENRSRAIEREYRGLCMVEVTAEHITGKEAVELARERRA